MSWLFGSKKSTPIAAAPAYTGLQLQTATSAAPIPIIWGTARVGANIIWYDNFRSVAVTQTSGGGKNLFSGPPRVTQVVGYNYYTSIMLALCEGPVTNVLRVWANKSVTTLGALGLTLTAGDAVQSPWSFLTSSYPEAALSYNSTAYVAASSYSLGGQSSLPNHNFEVVSTYAGTMASVGLADDADPTLVIYDFLTNAQYGTYFPEIGVDQTTLFGATGGSSMQAYCKALGIGFSPALVTQEKASSVFERWTELCNTAVFWSSGVLKFVPYGDATVASATATQTNEQQQIPQVDPSVGGSPTVTVDRAGTFVANVSVVYAGSLTALVAVGGPPNVGEYSFTAGGIYTFNTGDQNTLILMTYTYSTGFTYVPAVFPIYNLTDTDYIASDGEDPVVCRRSDPADAYNIVSYEIMDRNNFYNLVPVHSRSEGIAQLYGIRQQSTRMAHEICLPSVAAISFQLWLQRQLYIRNTYTFKLSWEYVLIEPMDVVTLTDSGLGLVQLPVRVKSILENDAGTLTVEAEEFPSGVGTAALYTKQSNGGTLFNPALTPQSINVPVIFEPPAILTNGALEIWAAVSGGAANVVDPLWGGADLYISADGGTSYALQTTPATVQSRMGLSTAILPAYGAANPDLINTLSVDLRESGGTLISIDPAVAAQGIIGSGLLYIDGELLSYTTATLVSDNQYNLTGLYRGLYGTTASAHALGVTLAMVDANMVHYSYSPLYSGQLMYFKFTSFNIYGQGEEPLAHATAYTFRPTGASGGVLTNPMLNVLASGGDIDLGLSSEPTTMIADLGLSSSVSSGTINLGATT